MVADLTKVLTFFEDCLTTHACCLIGPLFGNVVMREITSITMVSRLDFGFPLVPGQFFDSLQPWSKNNRIHLLDLQYIPFWAPFWFKCTFARMPSQMSIHLSMCAGCTVCTAWINEDTLFPQSTDLNPTVCHSYGRFWSDVFITIIKTPNEGISSGKFIPPVEPRGWDSLCQGALKDLTMTLYVVF